MASQSSEKDAGDSGPWLDYEGASTRSRLSHSYLRKLVMNNRIPYRKVGHRVLFRVDELDSWIEANGQRGQVA